MSLERIVVRSARSGDEADVLALLRAEELEAEFVAGEFTVAERDGRVVGCARLRPLARDGHELASVAVAPTLRGRGVGARLVAVATAGATGPIHALALAPEFFERAGFRRAEIPPSLRAKADGLCAGAAFVPMRRDPRSRGAASRREGGDAPS